MRGLSAMFGLVLVVVGCSEPKSKPAVEQATALPAEPGATVIEVPEFTVSTAGPDIAKGLEVFGLKGCTACHKVGGGRLVGPDLKGVTARRDETWIKKMILRPDVMIKQDEVAKKLFVEHLTEMPNQNVDPQAELPFLLAYLKSVE
jgi:mono/diheme cytochrome c family protein